MAVPTEAYSFSITTSLGDTDGIIRLGVV